MSRVSKANRLDRIFYLGLALILTTYLVISMIVNWAKPEVPMGNAGIVLGSRISGVESLENSTESEGESPENISPMYRARHDEPQRLIVPDLGVDSFILPMGIDDSGVMDSPTDSNFAGWFNKRATPGEPGLSIINGHKLGNTPDQYGIFVGLQYLNIGSKFKVEMGDGELKEFQVTHNFQVPTNQAQETLYRQYHSHQLNLITCIGEYLSAQETYDHRQIVVSKLIT